MTDFKTCLIKDAKLSQITDQQLYGCKVGASNNTFQKFSSVSSSASSLVFNVSLPSESIVLNREVLLEAQDFKFHVKIENVPVGKSAFDYGNTDGLAPFPLAMCMNTISSQINNTNVSCNLNDILPQLLRMNGSREIYKYNSYAPTLPDQSYLKYADGVGKNNNPLAGYGNQSYDLDQAPRGAHPATIVLTQYDNTGAVVSNSPVCATATNFFVAQITFDTTEPLFLSPYIFGNPEYNAGGLTGINTINLVCNIDSTAKRLFRTAGGHKYTTSLGTYGGSNNPFGTTSLLLNFLSTQSTDLIPSRSVTSYMDYPRYLSSNSASVVTAGASTTLTSPNLQLNQLPDKFIICVRKAMSQQDCKDTDSFWPITGVSVNLNNQSGLLSSCSSQQLWKLSTEAGSSQSWNEWSGEQNVVDSTTGVGGKVKTTGSLLVLDPPMALSLPAMLSSGSIGQFSFNIQIHTKNPYDVDMVPEICILCCNSGIMVSQAGSSQIFTGLLTKEMVVSTATDEATPTVDAPTVNRMIGGNMGNYGGLKNMIANKVGAVRNRLPTGGANTGSSSGGVRRYV